MGAEFDAPALAEAGCVCAWADGSFRMKGEEMPASAVIQMRSQAWCARIVD
jgi:hypothetical protein